VLIRKVAGHGYYNAEYFQWFRQRPSPGWSVVEILTIAPEAVASRMAVRKEVMAPNGFLHAASVIALADTTAATAASRCCRKRQRLHDRRAEGELPRTSRAPAPSVPRDAGPSGRTTQVWDAVVHGRGHGAKIALFRCTQMVLWPSRQRGESMFESTAMTGSFSAFTSSPACWRTGPAKLNPGSCENRQPKGVGGFVFGKEKTMSTPPDNYLATVPADKTSLTDDERIENIVRCGRPST